LGLLLLKVTKPSFGVLFRGKTDIPAKLFQVKAEENSNGDVNNCCKYVDGRIVM
jgi:hypothetical protein